MCPLWCVKCQLTVLKPYVFMFNRMLIFRLWGRLKSVSPPTSPSWTVWRIRSWTFYSRETWKSYLTFTCVTMIHLCTTHLFPNIHELSHNMNCKQTSWITLIVVTVQCFRENGSSTRMSFVYLLPCSVILHTSSLR